jgi:hypothetical protein
MMTPCHLPSFTVLYATQLGSGKIQVLSMTQPHLVGIPPSMLFLPYAEIKSVFLEKLKILLQTTYSILKVVVVERIYISSQPDI